MDQVTTLCGVEPDTILLIFATILLLVSIWFLHMGIATRERYFEITSAIFAFVSFCLSVAVVLS